MENMVMGLKVDDLKNAIVLLDNVSDQIKEGVYDGWGFNGMDVINVRHLLDFISRLEIDN